MTETAPTTIMQFALALSTIAVATQALKISPPMGVNFNSSLDTEGAWNDFQSTTLVHANSTKALQVVRDGKVKAWFAAEEVLATKLFGRNAATTALNNANSVDSAANAKAADALAAFNAAKKAQAAAATAQANLVGSANLASATSSGVNKAAVAKALIASDKAAAGAASAAKHAKKMAALRATATNVSNSATSAHEDAEKAAQLASQGA